MADSRSEEVQSEPGVSFFPESKKMFKEWWRHKIYTTGSLKEFALAKFGTITNNGKLNATVFWILNKEKSTNSQWY